MRILIVDDHALVRFGLRELFNREPDMQVVGEAPSGSEAVQVAATLRPDGLDLVLMDPEMPGMDGIVAIRTLRDRDPGLPVVVLSASTEEEVVMQAIRAGAVGYLPKYLAPMALVRALRDFHVGDALPMPRAMASRVLRRLQQALPAAAAEPDPAAAAGLSQREREVAALMADGARDSEIAERLSLSGHTVRRHVEHILRKLGVRSRLEAVVRLRQDGRH